MRWALALGVAVGLATQAAATEIIEARYDGPTSRYPHGVLGDDIEYDTLVVRLSDGRTLSATWTDEMVFEDIAPRLADLDGDGAPEVVTIESHQQRGARLSVWGFKDAALVRIAATPHIGTRFRWLAPVAWEDLDGDGLVELAYVDRPHLAKILRLWRFEPDSDGAARLTEVASMPGVTNHRIGWDFIAGGVRDCGQGPEMVLADADWQRVMAVRFDGTSLTARAVDDYSLPAMVSATAC